MQALVDRILTEGENLGGNILKVDGFINHKLEPDLTYQIGTHLARGLLEAGVRGVTKVVTAEVSGIAFALQTGIALDVPAVFARKVRPITMPADAYRRSVLSPTKGTEIELVLNPEYINANDRVVLIDDFLASGETLVALHELVSMSGAIPVGFGCVIEKTFQCGRERLAAYELPVVTLARIVSMDAGGIQVENGGIHKE